MEHAAYVFIELGKRRQVLAEFFDEPGVVIDEIEVDEREIEQKGFIQSPELKFLDFGHVLLGPFGGRYELGSLDIGRATGRRTDFIGGHGGDITGSEVIAIVLEGVALGEQSHGAVDNKVEGDDVDAGVSLNGDARELHHGGEGPEEESGVFLIA